jgi:hypothetical protein
VQQQQLELLLLTPTAGAPLLVAAAGAALSVYKNKLRMKSILQAFKATLNLLHSLIHDVQLSVD